MPQSEGSRQSVPAQERTAHDVGAIAARVEMSLEHQRTLANRLDHSIGTLSELAGEVRSTMNAHRDDQQRLQSWVASIDGRVREVESQTASINRISAKLDGLDEHIGELRESRAKIKASVAILLGAPGWLTSAVALLYILLQQHAESGVLP